MEGAKTTLYGWEAELIISTLHRRKGWLADWRDSPVVGPGDQVSEL